MDADTRRCGRFPDSEYVELAVEVFALLSDATRVRIVLALRDVEELSVNALAELVDRPASTVSQHLAKMRMARMVTTRQHGQKVFYRLANEHAVQLVTDAIFQAEHAVSTSPRHHHALAEDAAAPVDGSTIGGAS
ncbi:ArsR/SmtB family transcription factor [Amnibacterium kyonggiense]|uniref:ArsR family transcriptional regulator n=1 Tax=Amnibacterium kyonggiense TaxID=595671 RepID=A0A4R7FT59_9MICO|nr:metalloregulator ArsR/SmtB family transcription factor [Amnibacterium kyonggiense]TDS81067.1 ArsR family transcriptional regulator [Amnibacterium kyonggiense]